MGKSVKISVLHVILLCMTVIGLKNHVTILPPILEVGHRDGWLSVLLGAVIVLPWLFLLAFIAKSTDGQPLIKIIEEKNGKTIARIIKFIVVIEFFLFGAFTMIEMLQWVNTTFLPFTPMLVLFVLYFILCMMLAIYGLQAIMIANVLVLFVVIILGFFVAIANLRVKDYTLLLPILEKGMEPVLLATVFPMSGFLELGFLIFIQHHVKNRIKFKHFALMLLLLLGLTMGPLIGAIVEFGPDEASKQRYPAYEEWALVAIGEYINHLDFLSIYQWMTGAFVRIGFYLFLVTEILSIEQQSKKVWTYVAPPFAIICLSLMLVDQQVYLFLNNYLFLIFSCCLLVVLGIVIALLVWRKKGQRQEELHHADRGDHIK
ncbi:GerAB/ArcD/ProY family transporter [Lysinibacillus odysseyi]|uniref:Spore gernimation protein n=1 Tax=Lysinibacillus odysseyi 34hs-1 = NBRC 100172 TaxID=1220589 RepID=A0A0A3IIV8_9BACI|nr:endospore germination permease [Lysinibacillus odysseyi]KGR83385.1 spore gernimation protein [Lysinibacillus odysseyi 34hs-1 = NBRC 100172]